MAVWRFDLNEDEDLVLEQKLHWSVLAAPLFYLVALVTFTLLAIIFLSTLPSWTLFLPLALLVVTLVNLVVRGIRIRSTHLVITTERVVFITGILGRKIREIPIAKISNLTTSQSLLERMLNSGAIEIQHGGDSGSERFTFVKSPKTLIRVLTSQISRSSNRKSNETKLSPVDQLSKLAELRRSGSISQDEFEKAKSRILDQI